MRVHERIVSVFRCVVCAPDRLRGRLSEELEIPLRERNALLAPPVNAMRLSLHPKGVAPRIENLAEWRAHLVARLRKQVQTTGDKVLKDLLEEVLSYPDEKPFKAENLEQSVLVPLKIRCSLGLLSFMSTTTVFGTPVDVTLSELAIEMFFPADAGTAEAVRRA